MNEEWLQYLKDNNPRLYGEALESSRWAVQWRDTYISTLKQELAMLKQELATSGGV